MSKFTWLQNNHQNDIQQKAFCTSTLIGMTLFKGVWLSIKLNVFSPSPHPMCILWLDQGYLVWLWLLLYKVSFCRLLWDKLIQFFWNLTDPDLRTGSFQQLSWLNYVSACFGERERNIHYTMKHLLICRPLIK